MTEIFEQLQELGLFKWLDEKHNLANNRDVTPEYLDKLPITDIHRTVMNACVFRWFREKYNLHHFIERDGYVYYAVCQHSFNEPCNTYEEAELACLIKLIELIKQKP